MDRRNLLRGLTLAAGGFLRGQAQAPAAYAQAVKGTAPVKIRDIKTILTAPNRIRLVVVKVETTRAGPGRLGLRDLHAARAGRARRRSRST